jgi:hypothetical protein
VKRFFTVTLCLLFTGLAHSSASSTFRFVGKPGPYSVGFRVAYQYDNSRSYEALANIEGKLTKRDSVRPMQTLIWYPAQHGSGSQISYGDYLNLFTSEDSFSLTPSEAADVLRKDLQDYRESLLTRSVPALHSGQKRGPITGDTNLHGAAIGQQSDSEHDREHCPTIA